MSKTFQEAKEQDFGSSKGNIVTKKIVKDLWSEYEGK